MRIFGGRGRSRRGSSSDDSTAQDSDPFEPAAGFEDAGDAVREPDFGLDPSPVAEAPLSAQAEDTRPAAARPENAPAFDESPPRVFEKLDAISASRHGRFGLLPPDGRFAFAADVALAPIYMSEFADAAASYPIIFVGAERRPVAVMGLARGGNVFLDDEGRLGADDYAPFIFRQHPFALAPAPSDKTDADDGGTRFALCADFSSSRLVEGEGDPLFDDGAPSALAQSTMRDLFEARRRAQQTTLAMRELEELALFTTRPLKVADPTQPQSEPEARVIGDYVAIDIEALHALDDATLGRLARAGVLAAAYAHAASLSAWRRVLFRATAVANASRAAESLDP